jgi:threonine dehydratase
MPRPVREVVRPTTLVEARLLSERTGANVLIATETFQHTGSFKFRAGYHVAARVPNELLITASSGNFGQALAYAARLLGKRATVVMPSNAAKVKVEAVREHGGSVDLIDVRQVSRAGRVTQLMGEHPEAYRASAYDDPLVIEGNSTLGEELASLAWPVDTIIAPVGGGGLTSGIVGGVRRSGRAIEVVGAEPAVANDAARSLAEGRIVRNESEPQTIADGARTVSLGDFNWPILRDGLAGIVEVSEGNICEAVRLLYSLANLKAEPTGALAVGALLEKPARFAGRNVVCVVSGGNVDPALYSQIIAG